MAASVNVSIEPLDEYHVQEISYDGQEKLIQPLTMSENLTKLVHKIDFSKPVEEMETNNVDEKQDQQNKELAVFQPSLWPWDSVRNKLRQSLTEISVLLDVIAISKNKQYLVLDPVQQEQSSYKPLEHLISKKQSLLNASNIILSSVNRLRSAQNDLNRSRTADFQSELKLLRQNWRLKKSGNIILGDLSYRKAGSRYPHSGTFEVIKNELSSSSCNSSPNSSITQPQNVLDVVIPADLEGSSYIHVSIHKDDKTLYESDLPIPTYNNQSSSTQLNWQKKLEDAQNVLFCKELFSQLAREAVQLQLPIPALVIGNKIIITLFTGIQLVIGLCSSQIKNNKKVIEDDIKPNQINEQEHKHVLEHSLHQMLREIHYQALHQPMLPHPATSSTLGITGRKRYFAGPECTDRQTLIDCQKNETILEKITAQAQHMVLREQTMKVIDELVLELKDPLIIAHCFTLNTPTSCSIKLNMVSYGYENLNRTPLVVHIKTKSLSVIGRDSRKFNLSYEPEELRHLILSHISYHQLYALQNLAKCLGWKVLHFTANSGLVLPTDEKNTNPASMLLSSANNERSMSVRFLTYNKPVISISVNNEDNKTEKEQIINDDKWHNIKKEFKEVSFDKINGRNFLHKIEIVMACLTKSNR